MDVKLLIIAVLKISVIRNLFNKYKNKIIQKTKLTQWIISLLL